MGTKTKKIASDAEPSRRYIIANKVNNSEKLTKEDLLSKEGLILLAAWARDGLTNEQIASNLGISNALWYRWKAQEPELQQACAEGKEYVDYQVENALLKCALGYEKRTVKTITDNVDKDGNRKSRIEEVIEEVGPNTTACLAWLNNRKPDAWRRNRDNIMEYEDQKSGITINIVKGASKQDKTDEDEEWAKAVAKD